LKDAIPQNSIVLVSQHIYVLAAGLILLLIPLLLLVPQTRGAGGDHAILE
jgi:hypothetical protein